MEATSPAKRPTFEKVHGIENLYFRHDRGQYVTRVMVNGSRSWKSLETDVLTEAKLRHRDEQRHVERQRQAGVKTSSDLQTLGALRAEYERRIAASDLAESSKSAYSNNVARLAGHWPCGAFDSFRAKLVNRDVLFKARATLQQARVAHGRKGCVREEKKRTGFSNTVVNDTLGALRRLLDIAIEKRVLIENPFAVGGVLQDSLSLPRDTKAPTMPSRETLDRVFDEMRSARKAIALFPRKRSWVQRHRALAQDATDFAEFLAYSGARWQEAVGVKVGFYKPAPNGKKIGSLYLPGFKTEAAERTIPVIPPLARLLARLTAGRKPEEPLLRCAGCLTPLKKACVAVGIEPLTQHDLRHYFATFCLEGDVQPKVLAAWLGHSDGGQLVLQTYGHLRPDHSFEQAINVDFDEELGGKVTRFPGKQAAPKQVAGAASGA